MISDSVSFFIRIFAKLAIISPTNAIINSCPIFDKSLFVVYPIKDIAPKVPAVMKNTLAIEDVV